MGKYALDNYGNVYTIYIVWCKGWTLSEAPSKEGISLGQQGNTHGKLLCRVPWNCQRFQKPIARHLRGDFRLKSCVWTGRFVLQNAMKPAKGFKARPSLREAPVGLIRHPQRKLLGRRTVSG